ncbi:hypothetical protein MRX96_014845 [Rhipicephalus microplus]
MFIFTPIDKVSDHNKTPSPVDRRSDHTDVTRDHVYYRNDYAATTKGDHFDYDYDDDIYNKAEHYAYNHRAIYIQDDDFRQN